MRLKLISHHLYLFGGVLFGFFLNDAVAIPFHPIFSLLLLVVSAAMIVLGYYGLRSVRLDVEADMRQRAIDRGALQFKEQDSTGNVNA